jgi:addiction module HigA family antidote
MANKDRLPPIHPGELLREEFLGPLGMSAHELALSLRVPATRINDIVNEKRGITADTALRLSQYFGTTPRFWMNMQASWELEVAEDQLGDAVRRDVLPRTRVSARSLDTPPAQRATTWVCKARPGKRGITRSENGDQHEGGGLGFGIRLW